MAPYLFDRLCHLLTRLNLPFIAYEDISIRLLDPAHTPSWIITAVAYLSIING